LAASIAPPETRPWLLLLLSAMTACASNSSTSSSTSAAAGRSAEPPENVTVVRHVDHATPAAPAPKLAGARCQPTACSCRQPGDEAEKEPPAAGSKRLEIRLSIDEGDGVLESPTLGRFTGAGARDTCYYVDVPAGSKAGFTFTGQASRPVQGFTPRLKVSEYGPAGPWWYEIFSVECAGVSGRCDKPGADNWGDKITRNRKRGRNDPCGSLVVTGLNWETTGGEPVKDSGYYRDFVVRFDIDVKKFATQFAPHSTECVPK
jgi:hypothetical protein